MSSPGDGRTTRPGPIDDRLAISWEHCSLRMRSTKTAGLPPFIGGTAMRRAPQHSSLWFDGDELIRAEGPMPNWDAPQSDEADSKPDLHRARGRAPHVPHFRDQREAAGKFPPAPHRRTRSAVTLLPTPSLMSHRSRDPQKRYPAGFALPSSAVVPAGTSRHYALGWERIGDLNGDGVTLWCPTADRRRTTASTIQVTRSKACPSPLGETRAKPT